MLLTKDLIKDVKSENQIEMLKKVNIPDFTKCIAQFAGLEIGYLSDDIIKEYLLTWARNKERFYLLLGKNLRVDTKFKYSNSGDSTEKERAYRMLEKEYPSFYFWLDGFRYCKKNSLEKNDLNWTMRDKIEEFFPNFQFSNSKITHFFKSYLNAPESLVNKVAAIYENDEIEANHTISIDPVDMMLASETPYGWDSCYRLETPNTSSHADGCLAAVLDSKNLITYVWTREGKFKLYKKYDFKNIRYYIMREWIAISDNMNMIHFNAIYPGKDSYNDEFKKVLRDIVETKVAEYLNVENKWKKFHQEYGEKIIYCNRYNPYGYSEYDSCYIYMLKNGEAQDLIVYDEVITCPCGCGDELPCSDDDNDYNGDGFITENFDKYNDDDESVYCEYLNDYCYDVDYYCSEECEDCPYWKKHNPVCGYDDCYNCYTYDVNCVEDGVMQPNRSNCEGCEKWEECHREEVEEENIEQPYIKWTCIDNPLSVSYNTTAITTMIDDNDINERIKKLLNELTDNNGISKVIVNDNLFNLQKKLTDIVEGNINE